MIASRASSRQHPADSHDLIRVQGARENNLKDVSVEIPKRRLTVFTGVSGSGKSSLVFSTIAAESQRLINETYSAFVQGFMPTLGRRDVDVLDGLTTAIIVDQERMGANVRSTVGTATDANAMLRILFSRLGKPHIGPPTAYSFNVPTRKASGGIRRQPSEGGASRCARSDSGSTSEGVTMNWNKWTRQIHRWLAIAFTLTVIANFVAMTQGQPPAWVTYSPLLPLFLLMFTGLYMFVLPYATRWRSGRRTD